MNISLFSMGLGVYFIQLAVGLKKTENVAFALYEQEALQIREDFPTFLQNVKFGILPVAHHRFFDPRKYLQAYYAYRFFIRHNSDVIHVSLSGTYLEAFLSLWLAHKSGIPIVGTVHDTRFHPGDSARYHSVRLHLKVLEMCSQIIVHGHHMAADLIHLWGFDENIINIIPHGNYDIYLQASDNSHSLDPKPGQVLLFGRMKRYKGLKVLIRAAPIVAAHVPNLKIILAGRGEELNRIHSQLSSNPLFEIRNRYIPVDEVANLFSSSEMVVIPYIEASQSGPLHLAYTFGKAVVATKVGAISESLTHGREGLLIPTNDHRALAKAMIEIMINPNLSKRMGQSARNKAETELNWQGTISEKSKIVYQKAIEMHRKKIFYPGIGTKRRLKRVKDYYYQVLRDAN